MQKVRNLINFAADGRQKQRDRDELEGIMVHRCGVDLRTGTVLGYEARGVVSEFLGRGSYPEVAKATGGENAYTIMIGGNLGPAEFDGAIWQLLSLDEVGHHARRFSAKYLGVALIADPREQPCSPMQYGSLVDFCAEVCAGWGWDPYKMIRGHGEVRGAHGGNKAPGEPYACPGDLLDMNGLRYDVETMIKDQARSRLADAGLIF